MADQQFPPTNIHKQNTLLRYALAIWVLFCCLVIVLVINHDLSKAEKEFHINNIEIIKHVSDRALIAEAALEGFAGYLEVRKIDHAHLSQIATNLLSRYPFLYMFEVAQRVENDLRDEHEKLLNSIYRGYRIRRFDYDQTRQWINSETKDFYYPIVFQEPYYLDNKNILGLDLTSSDKLVEAMHASSDSGIAMATSPFKLTENINGYVIHRAVDSTTGYSSRPLENELYALLAISSEKLFDSNLLADPSSHLSLTHPGFSKGGSHSDLVYESGKKVDIENRWSLLPVLTFKKSLHESIPSQPFILEVQRKMTIEGFSYELIAFICSLMFLVPFSTIKYVRKFLHENLLELDDKEELYQLANFDPLTGLPNRARLYDHVEILIARCARSKSSFTIFFIDLDNFKSINDSNGHLAGDYILNQFGVRLSTHLRENELLARLGGDEFILVVDSEMIESELHILKTRIKDQFKEPICTGSEQHCLQLSIGEATYPADGVNLQALIEESDKRMYLDKRGNKKSAQQKQNRQLTKDVSYCDQPR